MAADNAAFLGRYQGQGSWIDIVGESRSYDVFVETSYRRVGDTLLVRGSNTSNAQGRFIAWSEVLELVR